MKILKTRAGTDGSGAIIFVDTIEYEGAFWLVPHWTVFQDEKVRRPTRIIRLTGLAHQKDTVGLADFLLTVQLPTSLLGSLPPNSTDKRFVVIEAPDLEFDIPEL